jgi:hypothetical protein
MIQRALPTLSPQPSAVVTTDLVGDRFTEQALA